MMAKEALREDVVLERATYREWMGQVDPERLVFLDESGIQIGMRLAYGYARRGRRLVDRAPLQRGKRLNMVGWMNVHGQGLVNRKWGSIKRADFRVMVEHDLVAHLLPGQIVVWDNARIHDGAALELQIVEKGATLHRLPRYSPDLNPIEMMWSKVKQIVRRARIDQADQLEYVLQTALRQVQEQDAAGWFEHCGYHPLLN